MRLLNTVLVNNPTVDFESCEQPLSKCTFYVILLFVAFIFNKQLWKIFFNLLFREFCNHKPYIKVFC